MNQIFPHMAAIWFKGYTTYPFLNRLVLEGHRPGPFLNWLPHNVEWQVPGLFLLLTQPTSVLHPGFLYLHGMLSTVKQRLQNNYTKIKICKSYWKQQYLEILTQSVTISHLPKPVQTLDIYCWQKCSWSSWLDQSNLSLSTSKGPSLSTSKGPQYLIVSIRL